MTKGLKIHTNCARLKHKLLFCFRKTLKHLQTQTSCYPIAVGHYFLVFALKLRDARIAVIDGKM